MGIFLIFTFLMSCVAIIPVYAANSPIAKKVGSSNPLMDHKLGADPYAITYNGRVYIYLSSDDYEFNTNGTIKDNSFNNLNRVFVLSSADMVNWTDHGAIPVAGANGLNGGKGIAKWAVGSWAPAAAHKVINGKDKFFLYFANSGNGIGVLTADSPIGPWTDPLGKALVTHSTSGVAGVTWLFDPAVLVDDDGQGYLYCGGGIPNDKDQTSIANPKTARVIKLGTDMISTVGSASTIDAPFMFEDSGIHKYNGIYYYSYCINFSGTHPSAYPAGEIGYMTSSSPMGPFTYKGHFLKNPGAFFGGGGNNHHTVFKFNNQWYVIYHTQVVSAALYGSGKGYRSPHINMLTHSADGTIPEVKGDYAGIPQIANLDPYKRTEAETIGWNAGIKTEVCQAAGGPVGNLNVTNIHNGDFIAVGNANFGTGGAKTFNASVASTVGGKIEIRLDSLAGTLAGTLNVSPTGGAQIWKTVETTVSNAVGVHNVFFVFTGNGTENLFNFDYWQFSGEPPAPHNPFTQIEAEAYNEQSGIQTEACSEGGENVGYIENGDYVVYNNVNFANGAGSFQARVASGTTGGTIEIMLDGINGPLAGTCLVQGTGDWQAWTTVNCPVTGLTGTHDLYLKFTGGSGYLFNLNWFKFGTDTPPTSTPISKPTSTPAPVKSIDLNHDGVINIADVVILALSFNTVKGDAKYVEAYDLNGDGAINMSDIIILAAKFNTVT
jgi:arabinoxylan arabinofuranohydrolase